MARQDGTLQGALTIFRDSSGMDCLLSGVDVLRGLNIRIDTRSRPTPVPKVNNRGVRLYFFTLQIVSVGETCIYAPAYTPEPVLYYRRGIFPVGADASRGFHNMASRFCRHDNSFTVQWCPFQKRHVRMIDTDG
jgi:hypothetical protein